jgi:DNA alkylation repair enzyme
MATQATAQAFLAELEARSSPVERDKLRRSSKAGEDADPTVEVFLGVRMVRCSRWPRSSSKVVGGMLREAGKHDRARLLGFLDRHAATAPRVLLRDAIEHLDPEQRVHYLNLKAQAGRASS